MPAAPPRGLAGLATDGVLERGGPLADTFEHAQAPLPAAARVALGLAPGASVEDAIAVLRERWDAWGFPRTGCR